MPSLEALEQHAARVRAVHIARARAHAAGEPPPPTPAPDAKPLIAAHATARAAGDRALATLFAEAYTLSAMAPAVRAYDAAWAAHPIAPRPEPDPIAPDGLRAVLALEPNPPRRAALAAAADTLAHDRLPEARALVDAMRTVQTTLGGGLQAALGLGETDATLRASDALLAATDECFRELDDWARARLGLARAGEITWADRMRSLAMARATERIPMGDRPGIASRWIARIGLGNSLGNVRDEATRPAVDGAGVFAFGERPGERGGVAVAGTSELNALGAVGFAGALSEALAFAVPTEARPCERLGRDRVHHAVMRSLGRGLFTDPQFVVREAAVDRGGREPVLLEALHAELFFLRLDAVLARFVTDALAHEADLATRLRDATQRAVCSAPAPMWAAHFAARAIELRPGATCLATLVAAHLRDRLRDAYDEDWWRNPRAGETLSPSLDAMRATGAVRWAAGSDEADATARVLDGRMVGRWCADAMAAARR